MQSINPFNTLIVADLGRAPGDLLSIVSEAVVYKETITGNEFYVYQLIIYQYSYFSTFFSKLFYIIPACFLFIWHRIDNLYVLIVLNFLTYLSCLISSFKLEELLVRDSFQKPSVLIPLNTHFNGKLCDI